MKAGFLEQHEINDLVAYLTDKDALTKIDSYYFFLLERNKGKAMLYGTGDAQSCYLRAEMILAKPPKPLNATNVKQALGKSEIGGKTQFDRVSNFWLEQVQSKTNRVQDGKPFAASKPVKDEFWNRFDKSKLSMDALKSKQGDTPSFPATAPKAAPKPAPDPTKPVDTQDEQRNVIYDFLIRRSCKFLMYDAIDQGKPVFYALDELDLPRVAYLVQVSGQYPVDARARKNDKDKVIHDAEGKVPVCSSELRELFRYWDHFQKYILFFEGFYKVNAPWERDEMTDKWGAYAKHRAAKLLPIVKASSKLSHLADRVQMCLDATAKDAILIYHQLGPSKILGRGMQVNAVNVEPEKKKGGRNKEF